MGFERPVQELVLLGVGMHAEKGKIAANFCPADLILKLE